MSAPNSSENASSKTRVAVIGGTGYGGAELLRLLLPHPGVEVTKVTSIDHVGESLESVHLNLHRSGLVFENIPPAEAATHADLVFLALPHKVSATMAAELEPLDTKIVDLSGDYRLRDVAAYNHFYGGEHPHPEQLGKWVYGMPELNREAIAKARRVASPGCFATTIALGMLPVAKAGWLSAPVQTVACTGSSGSGAYAKQGTHHPLRANNLQSYKPLRHQHTPEIEQTLRDAGAKEGFSLHFVPVSAPLTRGILANSFTEIPADVDADQVYAAFQETFPADGLVRVVEPGGRSASVVAVKGSLWSEVSFALGEPSGGKRVLAVASAVDNLVKGGAGQAVQSMNIMLGLPERTGIDAPALWP